MCEPISATVAAVAAVAATTVTSMQAQKAAKEASSDAKKEKAKAISDMRGTHREVTRRRPNILAEGSGIGGTGPSLGGSGLGVTAPAATTKQSLLGNP